MGRFTEGAVPPQHRSKAGGTTLEYSPPLTSRFAPLMWFLTSIGVYSCK